MEFPRHGFFSGMGVVAVGVIVLLGIGFFVPAWQGPFSVLPSNALLNAFAGSIGVLILHKVESYVSAEYDACPVYLTMRQDMPLRSAGQNHFRLMIPPAMAGLLMVALAMRGAPWPMLMIGAWLSQGLHEVHHIGKSIALRAVYPGLWSAIGFVGLMQFWVATRWFEEVGFPEGTWIYGGIQLLLIPVFAIEHRQWTRRYEAWLASSMPQRVYPFRSRAKSS